jgi:hypothetical protein
MKILDYPRPAGDTGIGFHWFPDMYHYEKGQLDTFVPKLKAMGASWLTVLSEPSKPVPELFIKGLLAQGIEPIIRVYTPAIAAVDQGGLRGICQSYATWGAHYVHVYNEPNLTNEWATWDPNNLPSRFLDLLIPCLETMWSIDSIIPVLTPLAPGGNYRDITFFRQMLDLLIQRGKSYLFSKLAVGLHNYALNHPLDWGKGGHTAWPNTQDDVTPPGSQDSNGFRQFEWYDELVRERVGFSLPMICGENGALPGSHQDTNYPPIDAALHAQRHTEMARLVMNNEVPYYMFNNAFWILTATDGSMFAGQRWFKDSGEPLLAASVQSLQNLPKHDRTLTPTFEVPGVILVLMPDGTVQTMPLEEYLRGVVPAEMPASSHIEALKAQAIAARSYAVSRQRHPQEGADVCTTTHCQVWAAKYSERSDQAVSDTASMVAVYDDKILRSFYFAGCDGHTRNSEDVWVEALPYLRSVICTKPLPKLVGHGVGLCQTGAMAMATQGSTAEEILQHYYTGAQIVKAGAEIPVELRQSVVQGTVRDQAGSPRPSVRIVLRKGDWSSLASTDDQGQYKFIGLGEGTYTAEVADTELKHENIQLDGRRTVLVDFLLPTAFGWQMNVRHQPGLRLLIGSLPRAGITVSVVDPWGHAVTLLSGSKGEYGPGGFEAPIWVPGQYSIRFLNQEFKVDLREDTAFVTFIEASGSQADSRLVTEWQPVPQTQALLQQTQQIIEFATWFSLEQQSAQGGAGTSTAWEMTVVRQPGLRLIIGRLPKAGIPVTITDPWGNRVNLVSGSKPEYGPGAFESPVWRDASFTITFADQKFVVDVRNETVFVTFQEDGSAQARLISDWLTKATATERLNRLQTTPAFRDLFKTETK